MTTGFEKMKNRAWIFLNEYKLLFSKYSVETKALSDVNSPAAGGFQTKYGDII